MTYCGADVRYWHFADIDLLHCKCLLLTQSGHRAVYFDFR